MGTSTVFDIIKTVWDIWNTIVLCKETCENAHDIVKTIEEKWKCPNQNIIEAIRFRSKQAFKKYRKFANNQNWRIPSQRDIVSYWETCMQRNLLPSVADLTQYTDITTQEANYLLEYLIDAWSTYRNL